MDIFDRIQWWWVRHQTQIIWFNIGWLSMHAMYDLSLGNLGSVLFDVILIAINYALVR